MGNGSRLNKYTNALLVAPNLAANTLITVGKVGESGLEIAQTASIATVDLVKSAQSITESVKDHTKGIANRTLNIAQSGLNTAGSIFEGVRNTTKIIAKQAEKQKIITNNRTTAIKNTSNERIKGEKNKIVRQIELNARKRNLDNQIKRQEINYQEKLKKEEHNLNMLKLGNSSKNDLIKFYENQINIVRDISKNINISLSQLKDTICSGKYFSLSLSCKRIKNFNGDKFRENIQRIRDIYKIYCENIVKKLLDRLKFSFIKKSLYFFTEYYIEQIELLTNINSKLLDYVNAIQTIIITKNEILEENKQNLQYKINDLRKLINLTHKNQSI